MMENTRNGCICSPQLMAVTMGSFGLTLSGAAGNRGCLTMQGDFVFRQGEYFSLEMSAHLRHSAGPRDVWAKTKGGTPPQPDL